MEGRLISFRVLASLSSRKYVRPNSLSAGWSLVKRVLWEQNVVVGEFLSWRSVHWEWGRLGSLSGHLLVGGGVCYTAISFYFIHSYIHLSLRGEAVDWVIFVLVSLHMCAKVDHRGRGGGIANCCPNVVIRGDRISCVEDWSVVCVGEATQSLFIV